SDDGTQLAFLSDREGGERQLYVMSARGGEPRRLTSMPSHAGPASWSPDGTRIAFSARVWLDPPPDDAGARERWKQRPRHVTKAQYKTDGEGYTFDGRSHLFIVDIATGETTQLTDGDFDDAAESWSPDGRQIAFSRTRGGRSEYSSRDIVVVGGERQVTFASGAPGSGIAFAAGDLAAPSDLYVTAWDGTRERRLTQLNKEVLTQLAPVHGERRTFTNPHGGTLEGWLFMPAE